MRKNKSKINTGKLAVLFIITAMALAGVGAGYSAWFDTITIQGEVSTGSVEWKVSGYSGTYVWKVYGLENQGWGAETYVTGDSEWVPADNGWQGERISYAEAIPGMDDHDVEIIFDNLFPCIYMKADIDITYTGTVPGKINDIIFDYDPACPWVFSLIEAGEIYATARCDEKVVELGYQLHENDEIHIELWIHIPQDNDLMELSGSFTATFEVVQWNEYPHNQCPVPGFIIADLESSTDESSWSDVPGDLLSGFSLGVTQAYEYYYLTLGDDTTTNTPIADGYYGFYVDTYPTGFFTYWETRGVYDGCVGTYEPIMWQIINGDLPIFYIKADAGSYQLIDGLLYQLYGSDFNLRLNGNYLLGDYTYKGTIIAECGQISDIITVPISLEAAPPNTIESGIMHFEGALTDNGGGIYTGTIDMTPGDFYMPGGPGTTWDGMQWVNPDGTPASGGIDVYAKEGGDAFYDDIFQGIIGPDHDAYSNIGGWGAFWTPDVPDYYNYQLTLTTDHWYLEYKSIHLGTPMSGTMNWAGLYATETDTGMYRGTVPADPDANDGGALAYITASTGALTGAGYWDMDWTWGSEAIPLELPGFDVSITDLGAGNYHVTLTPAAP